MKDLSNQVQLRRFKNLSRQCSANLGVKKRESTMSLKSCHSVQGYKVDKTMIKNTLSRNLNISMAENCAFSRDSSRVNQIPLKSEGLASFHDYDHMKITNDSSLGQILQNINLQLEGSKFDNLAKIKSKTRRKFRVIKPKHKARKDDSSSSKVLQKLKIIKLKKRFQQSFKDSSVLLPNVQSLLMPTSNAQRDNNRDLSTNSSLAKEMSDVSSIQSEESKRNTRRSLNDCPLDVNKKVLRMKSSFSNKFI
ncbi:unnamed protein product [Moneuplotes crassus]|uniref:Uncharacterized protein n=1 Tax=Euplotes crassus TaxID=5936 RepID=A0AAD1U976_EUPCR|nr:unnamed protein product [Moneuplotes crassus]